MQYVSGNEGDDAWSELQERIDLDRGFKGRRDHVMKLSLDYRRRNWGLFSFLDSGVREWNGLPGEIVSPFPVSLASFRSRLRKYGHVVFEREGVNE